MVNPKVSVLMPVYNISSYPPGWFERAVRSVVANQSVKVELCIVDDCSEDNTRDTLRIFGAERYIKYGQTEKNTGGEDAVNLAAEMATGDYFILLSCRSWYAPESLAMMAKVLDWNSKFGFVYGRTQFHGDKRASGGEWLKTPPPFKADDFKKYFASSFGYMYRREAWDNGQRYGCTIWLEEEQRHMTIADYHMMMNLIFKMGWEGYAMREMTALNYEFGGKQMNDLLKKYSPQIKQEFNKLWATA